MNDIVFIDAEISKNCSNDRIYKGLFAATIGLIMVNVYVKRTRVVAEQMAVRFSDLSDR